MYTLEEFRDLFDKGESALQIQAKRSRRRDVKRWRKFRKRYLASLQSPLRSANFQCMYCEKANLAWSKTTGREAITLDHFVPLCRGGAKYDEDNIVLACKKCNSCKGNRTFEEWIENGGLRYIQKRVRRHRRKEKGYHQKKKAG